MLKKSLCVVFFSFSVRFCLIQESLKCKMVVKKFWHLDYLEDYAQNQDSFMDFKIFHSYVELKIF